MDESALIELVYEGPIEKDPWMSFLHAFRGRMNSSSALLMFRLPSEDSEAVNIDDSEWHFYTTKNLYYKKYCAQNPLDYEAMTPGKIYSMYDFVARDVFRQSEYYQAFCRPLQVEYALAVYLGSYNGLRAWLNISRSECKGDYTPAEIGFFEKLAPHLQRAFRIYSLLEQYRSENSIYSRTIDNMNIATVLVDGAGAVTNMNESAARILTAHPCVANTETGIVFSNKVDNKQYECLIRKLIDYDQDADYEAMTACNGSEHQISILMRRIKRLTQREFVNSPAAIIYMKESANQPFAVTATVSSLFGLTRTEARLAVMLSNGQDLEQIAVGLGVTEQTARTYCKRVFAKTGTRRQADLVRLILTSLANLAA
jgi:DNA-binding CsgD family transcriptional regulator